MVRAAARMVAAAAWGERKMLAASFAALIGIFLGVNRVRGLLA